MADVEQGAKIGWEDAELPPPLFVWRTNLRFKELTRHSEEKQEKISVWNVC